MLVWKGWGKRRVMDDGDCAGWRVFKHYYKIKVNGCGQVSHDYHMIVWQSCGIHMT